MSDNGFTMLVSPEDMKRIQSNARGAWEYPADANTKGDPSKPGEGEAYWTEPLVEITGSSVEVSKKDSNVGVVTIDLSVPAHAQGSLNVGKRPTRLWFRLYPGDVDHQQAHDISLQNLYGILSALGLDLSGVEEAVDLTMYFRPNEGDPPFVLNKRMGVLLRRRWYNGRPQTDAIEFLPAEGA